MTRWAVIIDPLGIANVVSDMAPGPSFQGLTGDWRPVRMPDSDDFDAAREFARAHNAGRKPARPAERAEA